MKDKLDFEKISDEIEITPGLSVPIAYGRLTLLNIIDPEDTVVIMYGPNNDSIKLVYRQDSVSTFTMTDLYEIPDQNIFTKQFTMGDMDITNLDFTQSITLGQLVNNMDEPERSTLIAADGTTAPFPAIPSQNLGTFNLPPIITINWIEVAEGTMTMTITNNLPVEITTLDVEVRNTLDNSLVGTFNFSNIAPNGGQQTENVDLAGTIIRSQMYAEIVDFSSAASAGPVPIDFTDDIIIEVQTSNLKALRGNAMLPSQIFVQDTSEIKLETNSDERIDLIELGNGLINYNVTSYIDENIQFIITLPNTTIGGTPVTETLNITGSGSQGSSLDLSNSVTTFADSNCFIAIYELRSDSSGNMVDFDLTDSVSYNSTVNITNINIDYIEGYLGQHTRNIDLDTFDLEELSDVVKIMDKISGEFTLTNPILTILYENSMGLPLLMDINLTGQFDDGPRNLNITPVSLLTPDNRYAPPTVGSILINKYNSPGLTNFLTFPPPDYYLYYGTMQSNVGGDVGNTDFLAADSKVLVGIDVELPLELKAENLTVQDTIKFNPFEEEDTIDYIKYLILHYSIRNAFPLDMNMKFILYDSITNTKYDTIQFDAINAAPVDENGIVIEDFVERITGSVTFDDDAIFNLLNNTNKAIIVGNLSTAQISSTYLPVKILTWYYIDFNFGVEVKTRINTRNF